MNALNPELHTGQASAKGRGVPAPSTVSPTMTTTESNDRGRSESTDSKDTQPLRRFLNEELTPATMDLHMAGEETVDEKEAYTKFLLKAAEAGSLAEDTLLSGGDARDRALHHAREATFEAASLLSGGDPERHTSNLATDTKRLADAAEDLNPEVTIQAPSEPNIDDRDSYWVKHAPVSVASVKLDPFHRLELEAMVDDLETRLEVRPSDAGDVSVQFTTMGECDGEEVRIGSITELTPDQAESFAKSLLEEAEASRPDEESQ